MRGKKIKMNIVMEWEKEHPKLLLFRFSVGWTLNELEEHIQAWLQQVHPFEQQGMIDIVLDFTPNDGTFPAATTVRMAHLYRRAIASGQVRSIWIVSSRPIARVLTNMFITTVQDKQRVLHLVGKLKLALEFIREQSPST